MASFHDVRLPEHIESGAQGGPSFSTSVVSLKNGVEFRNSEWELVRHIYDVSYGISTLEDLQEVRRFFYARKGKLHSFRFKDWLDYEATDQVIAVGNGVLDQFQLLKTYNSGNEEYVRYITKPVFNTVSVTVADIPVSIAAINYSTGIITLEDPPALDFVVKASFQFDVPVRFDLDRLDINIKTFQAISIPNITLIEVLE